MIEVELPDGSIAEFDDGTPDDVIEKAVLQFVKPSVQQRAAGQVKEMGPFRKALYGAERSIDESALGLKQMTVGLSPEEEDQLAVRREMEKQIPGSWASRIAGDVVQFAAPTRLAMSAAGAIPKMLPKAAQYLGAVGAGAGVGALAPTLGEESRASNAATGAIFGAGGQAVGDLGGRAIEGLVAKNPNIAALPQKIRDRMSLGQVADRNTLSGRIASTTEEKLQSVPFVGNRIKNYRQKAVDTWRDDVIEQGAPKGFIPQGGTPREKIADAYGEYGRRYSSALRGQQVSPSQLFESQVLKITNDPRSGMTQKAQDEVRDMTMNYYRSMFHGNPQTAPPGTAPIIQGTQRGTAISADAETAKKFEAFLTKKAMEARKSNAPGASEQAKMFEDMERAWSVSYRRQLPSSTRRATRELDQTYPTHMNAQRAASYVGNDYGEFTPQQMVQAIRSRTSERKFAQQRGVGQTQAQVARDALPDKVPNSGTADRSAALGTIGGLVVDPVTTAKTYAASIPALLAMTTKTGRNATTGDTRVQALLQRMRVNEALRLGMPVVGPSLADISSSDYSEQ
jgi:hypothetical protein